MDPASKPEFGISINLHGSLYLLSGVASTARFGYANKARVADP